jgi:hypothetical protein
MRAMHARKVGKRARALLALSTATLLLAACNLLTGLDADYQLASDATSNTDGGGSEGGGPDALGPDAQADGSSGLDASDGAVSSFCESRRDGSADVDFFCSDFEGVSLEVTGAPSGWTGLLNTVDGGALRLLQDGGMDGSTALEIESDTTSTASRQTRVTKKLLKAPTKEASEYLAYELDFDFRVVSSALQYDAFGLLVFGNQVASREHGIAGYGPGTPHVLSHQAPITAGTPKLDNDAKWHHASVRLSHAAPATPFDRKLEIDGNDFDDTPTGHTMDAGAPTELWFGVFNTSNNAGRAHVQFDNVVFRRR